jgi:ABC-2 type transport system ATP-binding protein
MSSHVLSEVAQTVDRVVIVAGGRLSYAGPLTELTGAKGETLEAAFLRLTSGTDTDTGPDPDSATGATAASARG